MTPEEKLADAMFKVQNQALEKAAQLADAIAASESVSKDAVLAAAVIAFGIRTLKHPD